MEGDNDVRIVIKHFSYYPGEPAAEAYFALGTNAVNGGNMKYLFPAGANGPLRTYTMEKVRLEIPPEWGRTAQDFSWLAVWSKQEMESFGEVHWSPRPPNPTRPEPTKPEPTQPKPNPTEPNPTEPAPTEPTPTEPLPTEARDFADASSLHELERETSRADYADMDISPLFESPLADWLEENKVAAGSSA